MCFENLKAVDIVDKNLGFNSNIIFKYEKGFKISKTNYKFESTYSKKS